MKKLNLSEETLVNKTNVKMIQKGIEKAVEFMDLKSELFFLEMDIKESIEDENFNKTLMLTKQMDKLVKKITRIKEWEYSFDYIIKHSFLLAKEKIVEDNLTLSAEWQYIFNRNADKFEEIVYQDAKRKIESRVF